jgi:hypothetical protein
MKWIRWAALAVTAVAIALVIATVTVIRTDSPISDARASPGQAPATPRAEPQCEGPSNEIGDFQQLD